LDFALPTACASALFEASVQDSLDDETALLLLAVDDIAGDGTHAGQFGSGFPDPNGYRFASDPSPTALEIIISGDDFTSSSSGVAIESNGFYFTLCAMLAYGTTSADLASDPDCMADSATWNHPPEATTSLGDPAWRLEAAYAATAIALVR
jgi:hypothetical protein